ncbi:response regulator [Erythrobacter sp. SCSIO 43205]|uniref:response regulator n=1 Tax=Erythrobacter sp. SCSIO 43205 TaxID=2779361 RepID=UPI001CA83951|nr:response regulator [Erythrobacter sp. SCSIO 43205]UAB79556.1 response regulator [Erythrobacter sp. SCSIO 43205]
MRDTRVMVVDDSAAMRALFSGILENAKGVSVCGVASSAAEAREMIAELKPDVLTLDVEMPVMTGMEFLEEIMEKRPMPVIMLSSIAQAGSGTAKKALELGAVHCFPKPLRTTPEEFDATVAKLGDIVIKAANGELTGGTSGAEEGGPAFEPDGSLVVMACGQPGLETVKTVVSNYPATCPPTVIVVDAERAVVEPVLAELQTEAKCELAEASDCAPLAPGKVYLAFDKSVHVIVEAGEAPRLRFVPRDPVAGIRPSADLLLGSIARAKVPAHAGLLAGTGADGAKGLQILMQTGGKVFLEDPSDGAPRDRIDAVHALGVAAADMPADELTEWILGVSGKSED